MKEISLKVISCETTTLLRQRPFPNHLHRCSSAAAAEAVTVARSYEKRLGFIRQLKSDINNNATTDNNFYRW